MDIKITLDDTEFKKQLNDLEEQLDRIIQKKKEIEYECKTELSPAIVAKAFKEEAEKFIVDDAIKFNLDEVKRPLNTYALPHGEGVNGECPNCKKVINCYSNEDECCYCKQKIKWR